MDSRDTREMLDLAVDGGLGAEERAALVARLAADAELQREERELVRLQEILAQGRVAARSGFAAEVMAGLPAEPAWAARPAGGWRAALATLAAMVTLTLSVLLLGGAALGEGSPAIAALRAVADFAQAAALSGSGLLSASWRGVGLAIAAALTLPGKIVFGVGIVALNALLLVLLRRPRRTARATAVARRRQ